MEEMDDGAPRGWRRSCRICRHESGSDCSVENGVNLFKGVLRVQILVLERKLNCILPSWHFVMIRLVECVPYIVTKYMQGADGRTGCERLCGKTSA